MSQIHKLVFQEEISVNVVCNLEMTGELTLQIQPVLWLYHLRRTRDRQISGMLDVLLLVQNT